MKNNVILELMNLRMKSIINESTVIYYNAYNFARNAPSNSNNSLFLSAIMEKYENAAKLSMFNTESHNVLFNYILVNPTNMIALYEERDGNKFRSKCLYGWYKDNWFTIDTLEIERTFYAEITKSIMKELERRQCKDEC